MKSSVSLAIDCFVCLVGLNFNAQTHTTYEPFRAQSPEYSANCALEADKVSTYLEPILFTLIISKSVAYEEQMVDGNVFSSFK